MLEKRFDSEPTSTHLDGSTIKFNSDHVILINSVYHLSIVDHLSRLKENNGKL